MSTRCDVTQFILTGNCSTCLGWYLHPSSGAHTTVSTASGICHTITATCQVFGHESNKQSLNSRRQEGEIHFEEFLLINDSHFIT
jgi:hypothetical protein